ncbi:RNA-binding domain-containing protein [Thelephora ganbajun]|uniref:RNA-binding domain-containing protein n=1 Tax=Thelephora ganbajun TaxID=370292 RepID=A0ACB6Z893_THEGA|nr:RNA-binding domain-containing protein [Thelephora ganbajun]
MLNRTQFSTVGLFSPTNHHHHLPSSPPLLPDPPSNGFSFNDREPKLLRLPPQSNPTVIVQPNPSSQPITHALHHSVTSLWWGELEPWMDEEYAKQVCTMKNWDPVTIKVPRPPPDPVTGQQANNPGYCFLTFSSQAQAASVLGEITNSPAPIIMPNSSKPFVFNWASSVPASPPTLSLPMTTQIQQSTHQPPPPNFTKEYSIFVGDLAPEVSNSDLVAVFRNPVLGLRNDREPRFIRPFLSCKSAKIMLDPVTGVSRGYGFVRFTEESDQQRALIEMHGLYCLSRPMRISPATAKHKGQQATVPAFPVPSQYASPDLQTTLSLPPMPTLMTTEGISGPLATSSTPMPGSSNSLHTASGSIPSNVVNPLLGSPPSHLASSKPPTNSNGVNSITSTFAAQQVQDISSSQTSVLSEEFSKHHAQARAILSNLIGPNGEQLSSSDPYNTTVFVGGLSPLISEDTLRTFFAPFGDIHYVKVPAGKNCGFVQFIRKPDAERAIEKMQGFSIGGSRMRLSWGRSQYKAAQAAAQAAQTAAMQSHYQPPPMQTSSPPPVTQQQPHPNITGEQAIEILQKLGLANLLKQLNLASDTGILGRLNPPPGGGGIPFRDDENVRSSVDMFSHYRNQGVGPIEAPGLRPPIPTSFSPFSPDLRVHADDRKTTQEPVGARPNKSFSPAVGENSSNLPLSGKASPVGSGSGSRTSAGTTTPRYGPFFDASTNQFFPRSSSRQDSNTSAHRDSPARTLSPGRSEFDGQDSIHDLNGTLASLDLDNNNTQNVPTFRKAVGSPTGSTSS